MYVAASLVTDTHTEQLMCTKSSIGHTFLVLFIAWLEVVITHKSMLRAVLYYYSMRVGGGCSVVVTPQR
jgi:hypothetical protein